LSTVVPESAVNKSGKPGIERRAGPAAQLPGMRETQLLISYRGSPIIKDERTDAATAPIAAGHRIPDVEDCTVPASVMH
jgi:hypothetical protein